MVFFKLLGGIIAISAMIVVSQYIREQIKKLK